MDESIVLFIIAGIIAQLIDGCLGMGYGVSSNSFLISIGLPPKIASSSVHIAEVFTTFISGISHLKLKNVNKKLLLKLIIPGIIGGIVGAYILTEIPTNIIKPIISIYLILMGIRILYKAFGINKKIRFDNIKYYILGLVAGFFDAVGGGGWGPIVTSTLVANGRTPRYVIGTANTAEFFVTLAQAITFITILGLGQNWKIILGLGIGGVIAAPFAALLCKKIPAKPMMIGVGILILVLNIRTLILVL